MIELIAVILTILYFVLIIAIGWLVNAAILTYRTRFLTFRLMTSFIGYSDTNKRFLRDMTITSLLFGTNFLIFIAASFVIWLHYRDYIIDISYLLFEY